MCSTRSTEDRETTYRLIIAALRGNPAYLLLFSIGLLGGAMGVGATAVGFFRDNTVLTVLGFATWALLLAGSFLVIRVVENRDRQSESMLPGIDEAAWRAFLSGPSAERLAGHWIIDWYVGEGDGRHPYEDAPKTSATLITSHCRVFCSQFDQTTGKTSWGDGRLSEGGVLTMAYWSQAAPGISRLSGVLLLAIDDSIETQGKRMDGFWMGYTRQGEVQFGETSWFRRGFHSEAHDDVTRR